MMGFFRDFFKSDRRKRAERPAQETDCRHEPQIAEAVSPISSLNAENWAEKVETRSTYTAEERAYIERYITDAFGPIAQTFYDADKDAMRVDIAVTEPTADRRFYTLSTIGMGANRMRVPEALEERNAAFAELTVCLPAGWDLMNDSWPFHMLKTTARFPFDNHDMLGVGNAYHGSIMKGSNFAGAFVIPAATRRRVSTRLMMPNGRIVNYYLLLPLYEDEWDYITTRRDSASFWERYSERVGSIVVDPERESCIDAAEIEEEDEWNT